MTGSSRSMYVRRPASMKESLPGTIGPSRNSLEVIRPKEAFPSKERLFPSLVEMSSTEEMRPP